MEAALCSIVEVTSWMDWWTNAMKSLSLNPQAAGVYFTHLLVGWEFSAIQ